jgi:hypothetical protein
MGVPYVIGFDIKNGAINKEMDHVYTKQKLYGYIYDFCQEFYENIIQEMTVSQSLNKAKLIFDENIKKLNDSRGNSLGFKDIGKGPVLFLADASLDN